MPFSPLAGEGEEPVALLFEPGSAAITAILGVLKTGKIYVPMAPSDPPAGIAYILEDSQAMLIVTNRQNAALARALARELLPLITIDDLDSCLSTTAPTLAIPPDTRASSCIPLRR